MLGVTALGFAFENSDWSEGYIESGHKITFLAT